MGHKCTVKKHFNEFILECTECGFKGKTFDFKFFHETTFANHLNLHNPPRINISHGYTKEVAKICNREYFEYVLIEHGTYQVKKKYFTTRAAMEFRETAKGAPQRLLDIFKRLDKRLNEYKLELDNILIGI